MSKRKRRGPKFTPKTDKSVKPLQHPERTLFPEVRVNNEGTVTMSYAAFCAVSPQSIGDQLKQQTKRKQAKTKRIKGS